MEPIRSAANEAAAKTTASVDKSLSEAEIAKLPRVKQELVAPPYAPKHDQVAKGGPKVIEVTMSCKELEWEIDDEGAKVWALTFDGSVPGPLIVCHEETM